MNEIDFKRLAEYGAIL